MAPENTLTAFRRAVELGAGFIETDLQLTRDARLVALHDEKLDRTTNGKGAVSAKTLDELRSLEAGLWFKPAHNSSGQGPASAKGFSGERIPTVEEVLQFGRQNDIGLFLEAKATRPSGAEHAIVGALRAANEVPRSVVISFDESFLTRARGMEPLLVTGLLYSKSLPDAVSHAVAAGARMLLPRADRVTRKLVEEAHAHDLKVVTWTVNERPQMEELAAAGVEGIMTDVPDVLAGVVKDLKAKKTQAERR